MTTNLNQTNNPEINKFIIQVTLLDPIQKIIDGLKLRTFRDCDIGWLDNKLHTFIDLAVKTLDINLPPMIDTRQDRIMNDYTIHEHYLTRFIKLHDYFTSLKD